MLNTLALYLDPDNHSFSPQLLYYIPVIQSDGDFMDVILLY